MTIHERAIGGVTILDIEGPITMQGGADEVRETIDRLVGEGRVKLVVNVQAVPYLDSTAIGALVRAHTTAIRRGGNMMLLAPTARVRDLLAMTRLLSVLQCCESEAVAVQRCSAAPSTS